MNFTQKAEMTIGAIQHQPDEQELIDLIHTAGCYSGNKSRLYRDALREGLKALVRKHGLSVMQTRFPDNELFAQAVASEEEKESSL